MVRKYDSFAVDVDGELLVCTNGHVSGLKGLVDEVKRNSWLQMPVRLTPDGPVVVANLEGDAGNVLAALMSVYPERSRVLEAPDEALALLPYDEVIY